MLYIYIVKLLETYYLPKFWYYHEYEIEDKTTNEDVLN